MSYKSFYSLIVKNITPKTRDCITTSFDIPSDLKETFKFKAGQYLTIKHKIKGEDVRRSYSICSDPYNDSHTIAIKKIQGGKFSTFANETLKEGDSLEVMPPAGNFTLDHTTDKSFVFFAAGSGITPIMSHVRDCLHNHRDTMVTLIYGNKNFESVIFREDLEALKNKFMNRISVHHVFSQEKIGIPLMFGRLGKEKCLIMSRTLFSTTHTDAFMICGPNDMIFSLKEALGEIGVASDKIYFELFNTDGLKKSLENTDGLPNTERHKESEITVQMDGDIFEFSLEYSGQNLLDAAIANGADLPFSCKGGVCSTCRAKITEGKVEMDVNYALEPDEIKAGYVLLCQAHPRTPKVFIDFDQK